MSLEHIRPAIQQFIADSHNDLLILKGGWGVGKTFFWQDLIRQAADTHAGDHAQTDFRPLRSLSRILLRARQRSDSNSPIKASLFNGKGEDRTPLIGHQYYSYVSLFGINSLEELKNTIIASRVESSTINSGDGSRELFAGAKQLLKGLEQIPVIREWTGGLASTALFLLLKDTLICFDDIERRGNQLDTKDLLGLASLLKEQRNCKIAFIMNEGTLSEEDKESFRRHSEKIVDFELLFAPLPEEVFDYVFPSSHPYYDFIKDSCLKLGIKNIRILHRANRFIAGLLPHIRDCEGTVVEDSLRSLLLYTWCYYDKESGAPPLSHVMKNRYLDLIAQKNEKEVTEDAKKWNETLLAYGYTSADDVDRHLKDYVETGFLNEFALSSDLARKNEEARAHLGQHSFRNAWALYHDSFDDNEQEFVEQLVTTSRSNLKYLSLLDLQSALGVLRKLERDSVANQLVDEYVDNHPDLSKRSVQRHTLVRQLEDAYLLKRLEDLWASAEDERSIADVVKKISETRGWSPEDIALLVRNDVEDYYKFFKSQNCDPLYDYVKTCLAFGRMGNEDPQYENIAAKAKNALRRIASESRLNRLRVSAMYGVEIDVVSSSKERATGQDEIVDL